MADSSLEKSVERKLKTEIEGKINGAKCLKFVSPGFTGVPDRIILLPGGRVVLAETKRRGMMERQRQDFVQSRFRKLGFPVFSRVDSEEKVDKVVRFCLEYYRRFLQHTAEKEREKEDQR